MIMHGPMNLQENALSKSDDLKNPKRAATRAFAGQSAPNTGDWWCHYKKPAWKMLSLEKALHGIFQFIKR